MAAQVAVEHGCSLGWNVVAELALREDEDPGSSLSDARRRIDRYIECHGRIEPDHERTYYGIRTSGRDVYRAVQGHQVAKTRQAWHGVRGTYERWSGQARASLPEVGDKQ